MYTSSITNLLQEPSNLSRADTQRVITAEILMLSDNAPVN